MSLLFSSSNSFSSLAHFSWLSVFYLNYICVYALLFFFIYHFYITSFVIQINLNFIAINLFYNSSLFFSQFFFYFFFLFIYLFISPLFSSFSQTLYMYIQYMPRIIFHNIENWKIELHWITLVYIKTTWMSYREFILYFFISVICFFHGSKLVLIIFSQFLFVNWMLFHYILLQPCLFPVALTSLLIITPFMSFIFKNVHRYIVE